MLTVETPCFKSIEVLDVDGNVLRVDEGMKIKFAMESGEVVTGILVKVSGKKPEKTKLQIIPEDGQKEEIYDVSVISSGSLSIL